MSGDGGPLRASPGDGLSGTRALVQQGIDAARQTLFSPNLFNVADVPLASADELIAAISGEAVKCVLEMRIEQIVKHGHTPENDAMLPLLWLPRQAVGYGQIACERIGVTGKDRNLDTAVKALSRQAALAIAAIDRILAAKREGKS